MRAASGPCAATTCCYLPPAAATSGTIPWTSFTTTCLDAAKAGTPFDPLDGVDPIGFIALPGSTSSPFDYCLTKLAY